MSEAPIEFKDRRYRALKDLIETGRLTRVDQFFEIVPKSVFARHLHINYKTALTVFSNPQLLTFHQSSMLAELLDTSHYNIMHLIENDYNPPKKKKANLLKYEPPAPSPPFCRCPFMEHSKLRVEIMGWGK